ncbi:hypothetical protein AAG906_016636 [Vitis piasezkii]
MAGNEWINGYLEAILVSGASAIEDSKATPIALREGGHFNPTKYFVEEVVTGVDETDLHRTWIKVVATRNTRERSSRLENMCWRIWHLARKKKQLEVEDQQRLAVRRWEREQGRRMLPKTCRKTCQKERRVKLWESCCQVRPKKKFQRNSSNLEVWSDDNKEKKLYIVLISLHGLVRGENMELGRDSDTGGQVKYVVELSRALARMPGVYRVDLFTRQISSPEVDWSYGEPTEMLTVGAEDADGTDVGESSGAYIIRIPFGPRDKYLRKEVLWPHIQEFVDGALAHILNMSKVLGEQIGGVNLFGHIAFLDAAELVITSTKQEIDEQWGLYDGFDVKLEKVLRARARRRVNCHGRYMPRMAVIPPGMDFSSVEVQEDAPEVDGELTALASSDGSSPKAVPAIWSEIQKEHYHSSESFWECRPLRELANLTLIMGNRDDIEEMSGGNASVLTTVLKMIDKYDLYGQVAYPKHHKQSDVPDIYRLAAKTKVGVFINPALVEPFGLTLIEAAAHGLPMVATKNGGPVDIHRALNNGLLVDPHDQEQIASALLKLVSEKNLWIECRRNGWRNIHLFSWPEHCRTYLTRVAACRMRHPQWKTDTPKDEVAADDSWNDSLKDVQDMSLRLSVDGEKISLNGSLEHLAAASGEHELQDQVKHVLSRIKKPERASQDSEGGKKVVDNVPSKYPMLRRRRRLIVIALDYYDSNGAPEKKMIKIVQEIMKAVRSDSQTARFSGFALSTAMPVSETVEFMKSGKIEPSEFDALICSSGSEMYYPGTYTEEDGKLFPDPDYASHIDYHWGRDGLKNTIWKLMNTDEVKGGKSKNSSKPIEEDGKSSNAHCVSYLIKDLSKAKKVDDLRQKLRMRGLRCHPMYCRNSTRLQVIPLLASRAQALRYLFVRWRLNVTNMYVILGETGDTDYEELRSGTHKTVIMKGIVEKGSDELLRKSGSYHRDDVIPGDSPRVAYTSGEATASDIAKALQQVAKSTA